MASLIRTSVNRQWRKLNGENSGGELATAPKTLACPDPMAIASMDIPQVDQQVR
jgi:hypothetical protein